MYHQCHPTTHAIRDVEGREDLDGVGARDVGAGGDVPPAVPAGIERRAARVPTQDATHVAPEDEVDLVAGLGRVVVPERGDGVARREHYDSDGYDGCALVMRGRRVSKMSLTDTRSTYVYV